MTEYFVIKNDKKIYTLDNVKNLKIFHIRDKNKMYYSVIQGDKNTEKYLNKNLYLKILGKDYQNMYFDIIEIDNKNLLYHTPVNVGKLHLVALIRATKHIHLTHTDIHEIIYNNRIPYMNYDKLRICLKKLYSVVDYKKKDTTKKKIFFTLNHALNYASELKCYFIIIPECNNLFIMYHEDKEEITQFNKIFKTNSDAIEFLYETKPNDIINKKIPLANKDIDFINTSKNHIIDNFNGKINLNGFGHKKNVKIMMGTCARFIYENNNIYLLYVDNETQYHEKILLLKDYTLYDLQEEKFLFAINLLWCHGYLLNDFGYNYYIEYGDILFDCLYIPEWLNDDNINNIIKFVDQLK